MSVESMKAFLPEQQRTDRIVAALRTVSDEVERSMAQVALAWLRYRTVPGHSSHRRAKAFSVAG